MDRLENTMENPMSYSVQQADIDAYNADGVVPLRGLIAPEQLQRLAAAI